MFILLLTYIQRRLAVDVFYAATDALPTRLIIMMVLYHCWEGSWVDALCRHVVNVVDPVTFPWSREAKGVLDVVLYRSPIAFMLPEPGSTGTTFDFSKPAPPPDTSGLIQFDDDDDEDLQRYIGIGDDQDDA
ncbi:hypothetical protein PG993_010422 [Apiospora rasikravindrae]|uniref:Uncharacterized protein n=1 Tax=Apiospora rasikravindrae TaxID=990691 RepID=A0ABR1SM96_9PEZI